MGSAQHADTCTGGSTRVFEPCRNPRDYFAIFDSVETREADGRFAHFELISCKCVDTYVRIKKNQNQVRCLFRVWHIITCVHMCAVVHTTEVGSL